MFVLNKEGSSTLTNDKININGKEYEVTEYKEFNGRKVPVIKGISQEIKHPDGRVDQIVHVQPVSLKGDIKHG